jgi:hypothetical protein
MRATPHDIIALVTHFVFTQINNGAQRKATNHMKQKGHTPRIQRHEKQQSLAAHEEAASANSPTCTPMEKGICADTNRSAH